MCLHVWANYCHGYLEENSFKNISHIKTSDSSWYVTRNRLYGWVGGGGSSQWVSLRFTLVVLQQYIWSASRGIANKSVGMLPNVLSSPNVTITQLYGCLWHLTGFSSSLSSYNWVLMGHSIVNNLSHSIFIIIRQIRTIGVIAISSGH